MGINKKILCITSRQFPGGNANTTCIDILLKKFKENGCSVDYLFAKTLCDEEDVVCYEYGNILNYDTFKTRFLNKFRKVKKTNDFDKLPVFIKKCATFFNVIKRKIFNAKYDGIESENINKIIQLVKNSKINYDIIISVCGPIDSHIIAHKLLDTYSDAKWYPVYFDPFIRYSLLSKNDVKGRTQFTEKLLKNAEKIFLVKGIMEEHKRYSYKPSFENKLIEIHLPNLIDRTKNNDVYLDKNAIAESEEIKKIVELRKNKIVMTYAGVFYKKIRNPKKMIKVLSMLSDSDYEFIFMSKYCEREFEKERKINPKFNPNMLGMVNRDECLKVLQNSSILINLGNLVTNQTPSKIFEYIGMGKPIINFYFDENDTSLFYLKKYPLWFNFNLNNYTKDDISALDDFCKLNANKQLTFDESIKELQTITATDICNHFYEEIVM